MSKRKDSAKSAQIESMYFRAAFSPETLKEETRTVELVWSTGAKVKRSPWFGEPFFEELSMDPKHIRMDRLNSGAPLLENHNSWSVDSVIGVVERAWVEKGLGKATVRFSKDPKSDEVFNKVRDGILRNISVGYRVHTFEKQKSEDEIKTYRATDWEPFEVSVVPIGADAAAGFRDGSKEKLNTCELITRADSAHREDGMTDLEKENAAAAEKRALEQKAELERVKLEAANQAKEQERQRSLEIRTLCQKHGMESKFENESLAGDKTIDQVRASILDELANRDQKTRTDSHVRVEFSGRDEVTTRREGIAVALLHRFDQKGFKMEEIGHDFAGMSMIRIAEEVVGSKQARGMSKLRLAQRGLASSDFPEILANVASKTLRKGYEEEPATFGGWTTQGTLPDYKTIKRTNLSEAPSLEKVLEGGEYKRGIITDLGETYQVFDYGKILPITHQAVINDDLGAFTRLPKLFGAAAKRLEGDLVYTDIMVGNPTMADTVALFHSGTHKNVGSSAAIGDTGATEMKKLLRKALGPQGKANLNLTPAFLLCGPDKEVEAQKLLTSILAAQTTDVNVFSNSMKLVVDSRITGNKWFIVASPNQIDTVEVGFLEGMSGPEITSKEGFEVDGVMIKCKHVCGAKALDYRGMIYNAGA